MKNIFRKNLARRHSAGGGSGHGVGFTHSKRPASWLRPKSKRPGQYLLEEAVRLRKKVGYLLFAALLIVLVYFFFYSSYFRFENYDLKTTNDLVSEEVRKVVNDILNDHLLFILPQNNYFLLSKGSFEKKFQQHFSLKEIKINKKFPGKLELEVLEKSEQAIWVTNERFFIIDLKGQVIREISSDISANTFAPRIYDLSNDKIEPGEKINNDRLLDLIYNLNSQFSSYELPAIELDYFKVDSPNVNYVKLVTKQGFEIHLNTILPLAKQIYKLKQSLLAGKIDLKEIIYINLRINDQVIYK